MQRQKISLSELKKTKPSTIPCVYTHTYAKEAASSNQPIEYIGVIAPSYENYNEKECMQRFLEIARYQPDNQPIYIDSDKERLTQTLMQHAITNSPKYKKGANFYIISCYQSVYELCKDGLYVSEAKKRNYILNVVNNSHHENTHALNVMTKTLI